MLADVSLQIGEHALIIELRGVNSDHHETFVCIFLMPLLG